MLRVCVVCVCDRQSMRNDDLKTALRLVDDALNLFNEDDRVWSYRRKLISMIQAAGLSA